MAIGHAFAVVLFGPTPSPVLPLISLSLSSLCVAVTACLSKLTGKGGNIRRQQKKLGPFL
jgi:hypothetical protein